MDHTTSWEQFIDARLRDGSRNLYRESMRLMDRILIDHVLRETGDEVKAAEILGIPLAQLRDMLSRRGDDDR